jgi:XisH protein
MPARDTFHDVVVEALQKDGWTITHDPFRIRYDNRNLYADLGAEQQSLGAERSGEKILVEIKTFGGDSEIKDLTQALGQYVLYRRLLLAADPGRVAFLAMPDEAFKSTLDHGDGMDLIRGLELKFFTYSSFRKEIVRWWR